MKLHRWVFIASVLAVAGGVCIYFEGKLYLEKKKSFESLIMQAVFPYLNKSVYVGKIRFGFFTAHLNDVQLRLPSHALSIAIADLRIRFSPFIFFCSRFSIRRSVSKIILMDPTVEYSPLSSGSKEPETDSAAQGGQGLTMRLSRDFGVNYLYVKNGRIRILDLTGKVIALGEDLNGRLRDTGAGPECTLSGKLGAKRQNLVINGKFFRGSGKNHVSVQLEKAEVTRPIPLGAFVVTAGTLSGSLNASFLDSFTTRNIENNGWMRLENGSFRFAVSGKTITSVDMGLRFAGSRLTVDSLCGKFAGSRFCARGTWSWPRQPGSDAVEFDGRNIHPDSLGFVLDSGICRRFAAKGWIQGTLKPGADSCLNLSARVGGLSASNSGTGQGFAWATIRGKTLMVDSARVRLPWGRVAGFGPVNFGTGALLSYTFNLSGSVDSLSLLEPRCSGKVTFSGSVRGTTGRPAGVFSAVARDLRWSDFPLGNAALTVRSEAGRVAFGALVNSGHGFHATAHGAVTGPGAQRSVMACTLSMCINRTWPLIARIGSPIFRPDSFVVSGTASGSANGLHALMATAVFGPFTSGRAMIGIDRRPDRFSPIEWQLDGRALRFRGIPLACSGAGRLFGDKLVVDSLAFPGWAVVSGTAVLSEPCQLDAMGACDMALKDILKLSGRLDASVEGGRVHGIVHLTGPFDKIDMRAEAHASGVMVGGIGEFQTDVTMQRLGKAFTMLPFEIRKDGHTIASFDTLETVPHLRLSGRFSNVDLKTMFDSLLSDYVSIEGKLSGTIRSSPDGLPVTMTMASPMITVGGRRVDSILADALLDEDGIRIQRFRACDGHRTVLTAQGFVPFSFFVGDENDCDVMHASLSVSGDIIASLHNMVSESIDGTGRGAMVLSVRGRPENWQVDKAELLIPDGTLRLKPYLRSAVSRFSCRMTMDESSSVTTDISGVIGKRTVRVFSSHDLHDGLKSLTAGPLDFGILQIETPHRGLDVSLPGFMERGETGDLEPVGKSPFRYFSLSGPIDKPMISGTLLIRDVYFTYPLLADREAAPSFFRRDAALSSSGDGLFKAINWNLDLVPDDRKVIFFRNITGYKTPIMRFFEANIDQGTSILHLRGNAGEKTFKISGTARSYHGWVYFGKTFDRNFDFGAEFIPQVKTKGGYDNLPILWGSAEASADTSRLDRITITMLVQEPGSGALAERGRLHSTDGRLNVLFHLSSDFDGLPRESEREFYRQEGLQFTTVGSAGKFMSDFGEQYLRRFFLQRAERKLAKSVGLDVLDIETSIASNYFSKFYNRQFDNLTSQADYLALANVGVTVGRYFFRDNLFLKVRGGLLPLNDTTLTPQYSFGLEVQPLRYFFMDFDYGFYKKYLAMAHNPSFNMQLRLPISNLRDLFDF